MKLTHTLTIGAIALTAVGAIGSVANADATVASAVSINSSGGPNGADQHTNTVTTYYQGDNLRIEMGNGAVMLYTGGKLYRINKSNQTYSLMPAPPTPAAPPPNNNDSFSLTSTGQSTTVAGQSATQYTVTGSGPVGPPPRPQSRRGDGSSGGGGNDGPQQGGAPPSASITGQIWLSDAVKVDSGAKDALMIAIGHSLGLRGPLAHPLAAKLIAIGDAPLSANITITMPAMPDGTQPTTTLKSTVTSVSTNALDASLFAIPTGYTQVAARQGGRGGPGGGPGGGDQARDGGPGGGGGGMNDFGGGGPGGGGPGGPPPSD